jgi:CRP-like cAMP-binding protein
VNPELLASLPLLSALEPAQRAAIRTSLREVHIGVRGSLFREGDESLGLIWVVDGRLRVWSSQDAPFEVGRGAIFGAIALVTPGKRRFSVTGSLPSRVLELRRSDFERLAKRDPGAALALARAIIADQAELFEEALIALSTGPTR